MQSPSEYTKEKKNNAIYADKSIILIIISLILISLLTASFVTAPHKIKTTTALTNASGIVELRDSSSISDKKITVSNGLISKDTYTNNKYKTGGKQIDPSKSLTTITKKLRDKEKATAVAEYIESNVDIVGKSTVYNTDKGESINITVYSQEYDAATGMNKFNLSATKNGKSLLIHNPVRIYGVPYTVPLETTEIAYLTPNISLTSPLQTFANGTKLYDPLSMEKFNKTPYLKKTITNVESPTNALLTNLAYAFSNVEYGEPTFDGVDPTAIFYTSGSWIAPTNVYSATALIVGGGGGASGGYVSYITTYTCNIVCSCTLSYTTQTGNGQGAGGSAGTIVTVPSINVTPGQSYPITIGIAGAGTVSQIISANFDPSGFSCRDPAKYIPTLTAGNGLSSTAFSNTSTGGVGGKLNASFGGNPYSMTITRNHTPTGSGGVESDIPIYAANGASGTDTSNPPLYGTGASGGAGYGAGGGGGGAEAYGYTPIGYGGAGATGFVYITYTTTSPPNADFTMNKTSGQVPNAIAFTDTSSGAPTSWYWNFGDIGAGNTSTISNPIHLYTTTGTFPVTLTSTNAAGSSTVTFNSIITSDTPVANFTQNVVNGSLPLTVMFTDTSYGVGTSWAWNFGDTGTSTLQNPSHVYNAVGTYTVSLQVTNAYGTDTITKTNLIEVNSKAAVLWDRTEYSPGDTGVLTYSIENDYWNPSGYTYVVNIYDQSPTPVIKASKSVTSQSGSKTFNFDSATYPLGYYFGHVLRTKLEVGAEIENLGSDSMQISGVVHVNGYIHDSDDGALIDANMSITQGALANNQFAIGGYYNTTNVSFLTGVPIIFNVTVYDFRPFVSSFTPATAKTYNINVTLIHVVPTQNGTSSIGGRVLELPYNTPIIGATVNCANVTNSELYTALTNEWGYYRIDNLVSGRPYDLWSTKAGYSDSPHETKIAPGTVV